MENPAFLLASIIMIPLVFIMLAWSFLSFSSLVRRVKRKRWRELPSVSVVIPAFNEEKTIGKTIESLLSCDYPKEKLEIIVVDDGSEDKTFEVASGFKEVRCFRLPHRGKVGAVNFGVKKARGDFILVLDADTQVERRTIKNMLSHFVSEKVAAVTTSPLVNNKRVFSPLTFFQNVEYLYSNFIRLGLNLLKHGTIYVWGCATLYRASILKKFLFREFPTEDLELTIRMERNGYKVLMAPEAKVRTQVPAKFKEWFNQRKRWYYGTLLSCWHHRDVFFNPRLGTLSFFSLPSTVFWFPFATLIIPLIIYQILYWLPYQLSSPFKLLFYFFTWFSLAGPIYTVYMIPQWGLSLLSFLGILSAFLTTSLALASLVIFRDLHLLNFLVVFFLFPYFFLQNFILAFSLLSFTRNVLFRRTS